jgi:polyisoprenoid-binding protein YceI
MTVLTRPVALTGTWRADTTHSWVAFEIPHNVISRFRGEIQDFDAALDAGGAAPVLIGHARVQSIVTRDESLNAHLGSPEFFDAERHPEIGIASTGFEVDGEHVRIPIDLTIKGVTQPAVLEGSLAGPIADPFGGTRIALDLETTVDRRSFGLDWNLPLPGGGLYLGNDVTLVARLELVEEA